MWDTSLGWLVKNQRKGGDHSDGVSEKFSEDFGGHVEDLGIEGGSVIIDGLHDESVGERSDVELGQKSSLGSSNLLTGSDKVGDTGHLNLSLGNLGLDLKGLEEGGLSWITSGWSSRDDDITWSDGSDTGWGRSDVGLDGISDCVKVSVSEDETNVSSAKSLKDSDLLVTGLLGVLSDDLSHHGVLSHEDLGSSSKSRSGVLDLLGRNIVDIDDEALLVLS